MTLFSVCMRSVCALLGTETRAQRMQGKHAISEEDLQTLRTSVSNTISLSCSVWPGTHSIPKPWASNRLISSASWGAGVIELCHRVSSASPFSECVPKRMPLAMLEVYFLLLFSSLPNQDVGEAMSSQCASTHPHGVLNSINVRVPLYHRDCILASSRDTVHASQEFPVPYLSHA